MIIDADLQYKVEQFIYHETRLLDERRYEEWLELLDPSIQYQMPIRVDRLRRHAGRFKTKDELFAFDDDFRSLNTRVKRIRSSSCWTEDPPARARHFITNVQLSPGEYEDELIVTSAFLVSVSRMDGHISTFTGQRQDTLKALSNSWKITKRWLVSDQTVIASNDLTIFF